MANTMNMNNVIVTVNPPGRTPDRTPDSVIKQCSHRSQAACLRLKHFPQ